MKTFTKSFILACNLALCLAQPTRLPLPRMKQPPAEILFREGQNTVIECITEGKDLKYTWEKDGKPFSPSAEVTQAKDQGSLTFLKPKLSDEGVYRCFAETVAGTASTRPISFKRTFLETPKVTTEEHTPVNGRAYALKCPIPNGYPTPTIQWKTLKASKLENFLDRRATAAPDGTLYFSNITQEDVDAKSKFVCQAASPALDGEVTLAEHVIKALVEDRKPEEKGELVLQYVSNDMMAKAGKVTMIYCIYGGTPLAHPDWFKDGKDANGNPGDRVTRYNRTSGRRLLITNTLPEDQGTYTCDVNNAVGKPEKHTMKLTVVSAPTFVKEPSNVLLVKSGKQLTIPCEVSGLPAPDVTYTFNGQPLNNARVTPSPAGLTLKGAKPEDKGFYGCLAKNDHGDVYGETLVIVD